VTAPSTELEEYADSGDVYVFPASFAQSRLWFLDRLHPGGSAYNLGYFLRIEGPFVPPVLAAAVAALIERHEALRTTFASRDGQPVQVIADRGEILSSYLDFTALPSGSAEGELLRLAQEEADRPFDLACGPLLRAAVVALGSDRFAVFLSLHHIVSDAGSMAVLISEIAALYPAFARGLPSPLADLPLQYADFSEAQRAWLAGPGGESQLAFWRHRLAGLLPLDLPADRQRPAVRSFAGATVARPLAGPSAEALAGLAPPSSRRSWPRCRCSSPGLPEAATWRWEPWSRGATAPSSLESSVSSSTPWCCAPPSIPTPPPTPPSPP
jgi:hypothetical protein